MFNRLEMRELLLFSFILNFFNVFNVFFNVFLMLYVKLNIYEFMILFIL